MNPSPTTPAQALKEIEGMETARWAEGQWTPVPDRALVLARTGWDKVKALEDTLARIIEKDTHPVARWPKAGRVRYVNERGPYAEMAAQALGEQS